MSSVMRSGGPPRSAGVASLELGGAGASSGVVPRSRMGAVCVSEAGLEAYLRGESGLLHATTGAGKTLAVWFGPVLEELAQRAAGKSRSAGLKVLWVTPLRALAADTLATLHRTIVDLELDWTIEGRTGDTPPSIRRKQNQRLPDVLVTTPESLSLLLTRRTRRRCWAEFGWQSSMSGMSS